MSYTYDATDIANVEREINRLEHEQEQLKKMTNEVMSDIANIDTRICHLENKVEHYYDLIDVLEKYEIDKKVYVKKALKKVLFPGVLGIAGGYILGGIITNAAIGAVLGTMTAIAAISAAAVMYCKKKLGKGVEVAKKYNKRTLQIKIDNAKKKLEKDKKTKAVKGRAAKPLTNLYEKNKEQLSSLRIQRSIMTASEPVRSHDVPKRMLKAKRDGKK